MQPQPFGFGQRIKAHINLLDQRQDRKRHRMDLDLSCLEPVEIQQIIHQRQDMLGRTRHIIQVITLALVGVTLQQQVNETDDRRKRSPDIMADGQYQVLTAA